MQQISLLTCKQWKPFASNLLVHKKNQRSILPNHRTRERQNQSHMAHMPVSVISYIPTHSTTMLETLSETVTDNVRQKNAIVCPPGGMSLINWHCHCLVRMFLWLLATMAFGMAFEIHWKSIWLSPGISLHKSYRFQPQKCLPWQGADPRYFQWIGCRFSTGKNVES